MQALFDHIDTVKTKPHHVRRKVAFGAAAVIAGMVGLLWLGISLSTGVFAIRGSSFAESTGAVPSAGVPHTSQLAGSAAAFPSEETAPAHIQIVDTTSASSAPAPEQTVIPF